MRYPVLTLLALATACGGSGSDEGSGGSGDSTGTSATAGTSGSASGSASATVGSSSDTATTGPTSSATSVDSSGSDTSATTDGSDSGTDTGSSGGVQIVVVGQTLSMDFPVVAAHQPDYAGGMTDGFVLGVDVPFDGGPSTVTYATYLGGSDFEQVRDVALDTDGAAIVTGRIASTDLDTTPGVAQPGYGGGPMDAFVVRYAQDGTREAASYLGGGDYDVGYGMSVDGDGNLYVSGRTSSTDLAVSGNAYQPTYGGGNPIPPYNGGDFFGFKLTADASTIVWGSYVGGSADDVARGRNLVDATGGLWIEGVTESTDWPTTGGAAQQGPGGGSDMAIARLSADGTDLAYGTYFGGAQGPNGEAATGGLALAGNGELVVCGYATGDGFPVTAGAAQSNHAGGFDGAVVRFSADGSQVVGATYFGGTGYEECQGVAVDEDGDVVIIGVTSSPSLPGTANGFDDTLGGPQDLYVARLTADLGDVEYATFIGADGNESCDSSRVWIDGEGQSWLVFASDANGLTPTADAAQSMHGGNLDATVVRVLADGSGLSHVVHLGGSGEDFPRALAVRGY